MKLIRETKPLSPNHNERRSIECIMLFLPKMSKVDLQLGSSVRFSLVYNFGFAFLHSLKRRNLNVKICFHSVIITAKIHSSNLKLSAKKAVVNLLRENMSDV